MARGGVSRSVKIVTPTHSFKSRTLGANTAGPSLRKATYGLKKIAEEQKRAKDDHEKLVKGPRRSHGLV